MSCKICFEPYDHSICKPFIMLQSPHTFCISCINKFNSNKFPTCNFKFDIFRLNVELLDLVPLSNYDKSKTESVSVINQAKELFNECKNLLDEKAKLNLTQFESIKQKIRLSSY